MALRDLEVVLGERELLNEHFVRFVVPSNGTSLVGKVPFSVQILTIKAELSGCTWCTVCLSRGRAG